MSQFERCLSWKLKHVLSSNRTSYEILGMHSGITTVLTESDCFAMMLTSLLVIGNRHNEKRNTCCFLQMSRLIIIDETWYL